MKILPRTYPGLLPAICLAFLAGFLFTSRAAAQGPSPQPAPNVYVEVYSGEQEPSAPTGADFLSFFTPEVGFFLSDVSPGHPTSTGTNLLDVGGIYDEFPHALLTGLTQPTGDGLLATFKPGVGGVTASDNVAMLYGELDYAPNISAIAETGVAEDNLPEGVTIKNFLTLDAEGVPFFFATLQGPGVTSANSLALCTFDYSYPEQLVRSQSVPAPGSLNFFGYPLIILARLGDSITEGTTITNITTLAGSKGTLADGRWRITFTGEGEHAAIGAVITFSNGQEAIFTIPSYANEDPYEWTDLLFSGLVSSGQGADRSIPELNGYTINNFGLPCFDNQYFAVLANLKLGAIATVPAYARVQGAQGAVKGLATIANPTTVTSTNNVVLVYGDINGVSAYVMASKGESVTEDSDGNTLTGVTISGLSDPVVGNYGSVAFMITMAGTHAPATGIEYYDNDDSGGPHLLANVGGAAPGVTGTGTVGHWASFTSLVLPSFIDFQNYQTRVANVAPALNEEGEGYLGPIFLGTLKISAADGVNAGNNLGLWGVDGNNVLQLLFRSGQKVSVNGITKTVRTFTALTAAPGSVGAVHGYDDYGDVAVIATFTDGTSAMIIISSVSSTT